MSRFFAASVTLAAEGCAGHDSLATLAYSVRQTSSAFAYGTDERAVHDF